MGLGQIICAALVLIVEFFKWWKEKDIEKKEDRSEIVSTIRDAIKERDVAKYTYALERARRLRP